MNFWETLRELLTINLINLFNTDWSVVQYKRRDFAIWAATLLIAAFVLKILWPRLYPLFWHRPFKPKSSYEHSGYVFIRQHKPGLWYKLATLTTKLFVVVASGLLLVTIADPYISLSRQSRSTKSREIFYLQDSSVSMGFRYKNQLVARAEVVHDFLLDLIAKRKDRNDRAALIVYATYPYRITDPTTDSNSLLFSVDNAPQVIADPVTPTIPIYNGIFIVKDFVKEEFGGESDLFLGLRATIELFDEKGDPQVTKEIANNPAVKRRSVIIITDGASSRDPEPQFKELKKRWIVPFLVYIDPDKQAERKIHGDNAPEVMLPSRLLQQIKRYGGEYFIATDHSSLDQICEQLDRLHPAIIEVKTYTTEKHLYRLPLVASLVCFCLAIFTRLLFWPFHQVI